MPLGNSANFLFVSDDSLEIISTESSGGYLAYPPATKMDFGSTEIKKTRIVPTSLPIGKIVKNEVTYCKVDNCLMLELMKISKWQKYGSF